ncbi:DgyrCDS5738 [Dimorphilus gyrociliatus]|uniref:DgyrCDS5738 n=1 Tax=Dimorphilus gyrociliatus TaxID=2664684 RepID=A0A7I8VMC9_9ANNE|nr:DgyrCDS5738 [Dimorphilus gyrociliatus]
MIGYWEYFCVALLEVFLGLKIVLSGDKINNNERNLIIMNHRTRLDWMFFWCVLFRDSNIATEKIVLKQPLKYVPGAGWAMQAASYIFLKRKWEDDKSYITDILNYLSQINHKSQILIFPEGTDFCPNSSKRSDAFAAKNNLETYKYVLHPRTTGFVYFLQTMRKNKHLDALYDITVAYPDELCSNELSFAFGKRPKTVHFHIDRHLVENLRETDEELTKWCQEKWREKEANLSAFYNETKNFNDERVG